MMIKKMDRRWIYVKEDGYMLVRVNSSGVSWC
jgi:hypothetical protein